MYFSSSDISVEKGVAMGTLFHGWPGYGNRRDLAVHHSPFLSTTSEGLEPADTRQMPRSRYFTSNLHFFWRYVYISGNSQHVLLSIIEALNALSDWILAGLPIVFLWKSQMKIKVKVGICVLMGMGFL